MLCVVSGQVQGAGKTAIISRVIAATAQAGWAAIRITDNCYPRVVPQEGVRWTEETVPNSRTEAGVYLAAGAKRACCLQLRSSGLEAALPYVRKMMWENDNVLIESRCPLPELPADLSIYVAGDSEHSSAPAPWANYIDAFVMIDAGKGVPNWRGSRPLHLVHPSTYSCTALIQMVRERLHRRMAPPTKQPILASPSL